jgi:hypothetical protein
MRRLTLVIIMAAIATSLGCTSHYVPLDDPSLATFKSMYAVDRSRFGMTPLPKEGRVVIERRMGGEADQLGYDVMLHIYSKATHHVAFRKNGDAYSWVGESEVCSGPRMYDSPDGKLNEQLVISYFEHVLHQQNGRTVTYFGPDATLKGNIPSSQVTRLLHEWGCAGS